MFAWVWSINALGHRRCQGDERPRVGDKHGTLPVVVWNVPQYFLHDPYWREVGIFCYHLYTVVHLESRSKNRHDGDWSIPVRWQIFEDCLARFTLPEQKRIIQDLLDYTGFSDYVPPDPNDIATVRRWLWKEDLAGQIIAGVEGASNNLDITLGNGYKLRIQFVKSPQIEYPDAT
jgi:hypothetical protein